MSDIQTPLLKDDAEARRRDGGGGEFVPADGAQPSREVSVATKTLSFSGSGFFLSAHIAAVGKLLADLGGDGASAASIVATYKSVILGSCVGVVLVTGIEMGKPVGQRNFVEAGHVAKTGWAVTGGLGVAASGVMLLAGPVLPHIFAEGSAKIAAKFFQGYAAVSIPILLLVASPQVAFQAGDYWVPPVSAAGFFLSSTALSYLLGYSADLGALGVGLGGSIAGWLSASALQLWFKRKRYSKFELYTWDVPEFKKRLKKFFGLGWRFSLQRLTEWGNLALIVTVLGAQNNTALKEAQPGIQYVALLAATLQGAAQATGMVVARARGRAIELAGSDVPADQNLCLQEQNKMSQAIKKAMFLTILASAGVTLPFYFLRGHLADFYLSDDATPSIREHAGNALAIGVAGLIPDAGRIVLSGGLRAWQDLLYPTGISFLFMSVFALLLGWVVGFTTDASHAAEFMFAFRFAALLFTLFFIGKRCMSRINEERRGVEIEELPAADGERQEEGLLSRARNAWGRFWGSSGEQQLRLNVVEVEEAAAAAESGRSGELRV